MAGHKPMKCVFAAESVECAGCLDLIQTWSLTTETNLLQDPGPLEPPLLEGSESACSSWAPSAYHDYHDSNLTFHRNSVINQWFIHDQEASNSGGDSFETQGKCFSIEQQTQDVYQRHFTWYIVPARNSVWNSTPLCVLEPTLLCIELETA